MTDLPVAVVGPASCTTAIGDAQPLNGTVFLTTRGTHPLLVAAYDLAAEQVSRTYELPSGIGAWGLAAIGDRLYVATHQPADIWELEPHTGDTRWLCGLAPDDFTWRLSSTPDGYLVVGTSPGCRVLVVDPRSGSVTDHGPAVSGETYARAVAADDRAIYVGVGMHAALVRIDRRTGERHELFSGRGSGHNLVYSVAMDDEFIVAGVSPRAEVAVVTRCTGRAERIDRVIELTDAQDNYIPAVSVSRGKALVAARPSGLWYELDLRTGRIDCLGCPRIGAAAVRFLDLGDVVYGFLNEGAVASYDRSTGRFTVTDLGPRGFPSRPELPMSLAADADHVYVGGKGGLQVHELPTGRSRRVYVPGEPKTIAPGTPVVLGLYDPAHVGFLDLAADSVEVVAPFGNEQARPQGVAADRSADLVLMTSQPEVGFRVGGLAIARPATRTVEVVRGLLGEQTLYGVAVDDGVAYLGGDIYPGYGLDPCAGPARLAAYDLSSRTVRWMREPEPSAERIVGLCVVGAHLVGMTDDGWLFVTDKANGDGCRSVRVGERGGDVVSDGHVAYATTGEEVVRVDSGTDPLDTSVLAAGLGADWYGEPKLALGANGTLYTVRGRDLLAITIPARSA